MKPDTNTDVFYFIYLTTKKPTNRKEGSKEECEGIAELGEHKSVVVSSQADCQLLRHWHGWTHLQDIVFIFPIAILIAITLTIAIVIVIVIVIVIHRMQTINVRSVPIQHVPVVKVRIQVIYWHLP